MSGLAGNSLGQSGLRRDRGKKVGVAKPHLLQELAGGDLTNGAGARAGYVVREGLVEGQEKSLYSGL